jgi:molybdate transport system substrate-binding protein
MDTLDLLCAGAAQGLVKALQGRFHDATGATLQARFGAVGVMKEALLAGERCDVMVVTAAMVDTLVAEGRLRADTRAALGRVRTGVAVRAGDAAPEVSTPDALRQALRAADAIYFPDAERSTAGIHFAGVLRQVSLWDELQGRLRTYPNGATAMRELAASTAARPIGCTQVTEINYTTGITLVAVLPPQFELATVYTAAVAATARDPALAARFVALLAGAEALPLRTAGGFEP